MLVYFNRHVWFPSRFDLSWETKLSTSYTSRYSCQPTVCRLPSPTLLTLLPWRQLSRSVRSKKRRPEPLRWLDNNHRIDENWIEIIKANAELLNVIDPQRFTEGWEWTRINSAPQDLKTASKSALTEQGSHRSFEQNRLQRQQNQVRPNNSYWGLPPNANVH